MPIKRTGNWNGARRLTQNLQKEIVLANTTTLRQIGLKTERLIIKWIERQPSSWPPLSDKYKRYKSKKGYSNLMLRRTGDMINRITSYATPEMVFIGVKKNVKYKNGEEIANVAAVMEFGSKKRNIPLRPFLSPAHSVMLRKIREERLFQKMLLENLKKKYAV